MGGVRAVAAAALALVSSSAIAATPTPSGRIAWSSNQGGGSNVTALSLQGRARQLGPGA